MATYGLKIDTGTVAGAADISQLDSSLTNKYMFANFSTIPSDGKVNLGTNNALFVRFPSPSSGQVAHYALQKINETNATHRIRRITTFPRSSSVGSFETTTVSGEMCIISDMSETLTNSFLSNSTQDYGLQVKNSNGTVILDTRGFADGGNFAPKILLEPMTKIGVGTYYDQQSTDGNANSKLADLSSDRFVFFEWTGVSSLQGTTNFVNALSVANNYSMVNSVTGSVQSGQSPISGYFFYSFVFIPTATTPLPLARVLSYPILIGERFTS